jgi:hypothetical protein
MRHSWRQRLANGITAATLSRFLIIAALLAVGGLAMVASVSSSGPGFKSIFERSAAKVATDRGSGRARANVARRAPEAMLLPAPLVGTITVDRTDDNAGASACTAAPNDCSLRGAIAFANSSPATTINVPAGNYNLTISGAEAFYGDNSIGDLDISGNNTSIVGAGAATTIIRQTSAGDRVIEVNPNLDPGFITSISGVTITGGTETSGVGGGGIISGSLGNSLTISNAVISGNSATGVGSFGGGGICHTGGDLTVSGTTFSTNSTSTSGGAISYSAGDPLGRFPSTGVLNVSGSTFASNTANSSGAGGGALDLYDFNLSSGSYTLNSSSFSNNHATNGSGGAIIVESGGPLTVRTSSFATNSAGNSGGAIFSSGSAVSVMYSRLMGNTVPMAANGSTFFQSSGLFTANDDWWGINTGAGPNDFRNPAGSVMPITWLQLRASGNPNPICVGGTSNITADIKQRNAGAPLTVELNGLPPFPAMFINTTPAVGTLSGASANFVDGQASATFTGTATGTALIDVIGDNQTVTATIMVQENTTSDPADQLVCEGGTATFTTNASGPGPFTFVWKKGATVLNNGDLGGRATIVSGASSSTLTISSVQPSDADTYTVEATGSCSTATQTATLTINQATTTTDPADATVCQGASAGFSTTASGTGPFHYAWTLDGSPFDGDNASISVPTGSVSVGNHTVVVTTSGACGSASQTATLTVQQGTTTTDPADATVCQGATANFSTTASGTGPFHYAWTLDGSPFNGDNSSISVPTGSLSVGNHAVVVTTSGACGSASQTATLTVQENTSATAPVDKTVCQGAMANFSTTASGTGLTYQWKLDGSNIAGATNSSVTIDTTSVSVGGHTVDVVVSGTCGSVTKSATLTVQENTSATTPADKTVCQGAMANFSTTASGTGLTYQWKLDGSNIAGATNSSVTIDTTSVSVSGHTVDVVVSGTCGSVTKSATLIVQANTATSDPPDQTVCQGATAAFSTIASGTGPFHYAWTVDGSPSGSDSASLSVPTGSLSVGNHTVVVTTSGSCGSASQSATLTVQPTTATSDPPDQTVCQGTLATFSTTASGTGPFHYAWTLDGSPFNGDSSSINVPTGSLSVGNHTVVVTTSGTCGSASQSATLTVNSAPVVTTNPVSQTATSGTVTFTAAASGSPTPTVQWQVSTNGGASFSNISGATSTSLTVTVSASVNGNKYRAVFTNSCGTATTTAATLTTCQPPVITLSHASLEMWPPNHKYKTFNITDFISSATSNCYGNITSSVVVTSVTSDEPENSGGDGNTLQDIVIAQNCKSVNLRSERDGGGNGRVYTINFKVTDAAGNTTTATARVTVPHSQNGTGAVDSGPHYVVSSNCP